MMLNHQPRLFCPACRSPFRLDELKQLVGMPHTVDDWFDRLAQAKHGGHANIPTPPKTGKPKKSSRKTGKKSSSDDGDTSVPLSRCSTIDIRNSIDNAIKDLQDLCSVGGEGDPTEHAPFSYPHVVQSVELRSRKSSVKLSASPRKRRRPQKKETSRKPRPKRSAASAAAAQMTSTLAEQDDVDMSDFESEQEAAETNESSSDEFMDGDDDQDNKRKAASFETYISVSIGYESGSLSANSL
jgi:hypothetical protein